MKNDKNWFPKLDEEPKKKEEIKEKKKSWLRNLFHDPMNDIYNEFLEMELENMKKKGIL